MQGDGETRTPGRFKSKRREHGGCGTTRTPTASGRCVHDKPQNWPTEIHERYTGAKSLLSLRFSLGQRHAASATCKVQCRSSSV